MQNTMSKFNDKAKSSGIMCKGQTRIGNTKEVWLSLLFPFSWLQLEKDTYPEQT